MCAPQQARKPRASTSAADSWAARSSDEAGRLFLLTPQTEGSCGARETPSPAVAEGDERVGDGVARDVVDEVVKKGAPPPPQRRTARGSDAGAGAQATRTEERRLEPARASSAGGGSARGAREVKSDVAAETVDDGGEATLPSAVEPVLAGGLVARATAAAMAGLFRIAASATKASTALAAGRRCEHEADDSQPLSESTARACSCGAGRMGWYAWSRELPKSAWWCRWSSRT